MMTGRTDVVSKPEREFRRVDDGMATTVRAWSALFHPRYMGPTRAVAVFTANRQFRERRIQKTAIAIGNRLSPAAVAGDTSG